MVVDISKGVIVISIDYQSLIEKIKSQNKTMFISGRIWSQYKMHETSHFIEQVLMCIKLWYYQ